MFLKVTTMPCGVFCVFMTPMTLSSEVWPVWSLPAVRTALPKSKRGRLAPVMAKVVRVCNDRAKSAKLEPLAARVVSPAALPASTERRLKAPSAVATSTACSLSLPLRRNWPLSAVFNCTVPFAVPPPNCMSSRHSFCSPKRVRRASVSGL